MLNRKTATKMNFTQQFTEGIFIKDACQNPVFYKIQKETGKALKVIADDSLHNYNKKMPVWIPKSVLENYREDEFKIKNWFLKKMNDYQHKALNRLI